jgi:hypothetical protein
VHLWASNRLVFKNSRECCRYGILSCGIEERNIFRFQAGSRECLSQSVQILSVSYPASYSEGNRMHFPRRLRGRSVKAITYPLRCRASEWVEWYSHSPMRLMACTETTFPHLSLSEETGITSRCCTNQAVTVSKTFCFLWRSTMFLEYCSGERQVSKKPAKRLHQPTKQQYELRLRTLHRKSSIFTSYQNLKLEAIN